MSVDTASSFSIALKPDDVFRRIVFTDDYQFLPQFFSFLAGSTVTQSSQKKKKKKWNQRTGKGAWGDLFKASRAWRKDVGFPIFTLTADVLKRTILKVMMDEFLFQVFHSYRNQP